METRSSQMQLPGLQSSLSADANLREDKEAAPSVHSSPKAYDEWVECVKCKKWRLCMPHIKAEDLPESWECREMTWLPGWNHCKFPQVETTAAVYKLLGWALPSNDVGVLNVRGDIPEPAAALNWKQPIANTLRPAAMATVKYKVKDENTMGIKKVKIRPASSDIDPVAVAMDVNSKGLAKKITIRPGPIAVATNGIKEGTAKKIRLSPASSDPVSKVMVEDNVKDSNRKGVPKNMKPVYSNMKKWVKRATGSDKSGDSDIHKCSTTVGAEGRNKKILKKVHGTDQWQISELNHFGDRSVGSKERAKPQVCGDSNSKKQLTIVVSKEREKPQACGDSDFKLKKQVMHMSPGSENQVGCSRSKGIEVPSRKEEAAYFIMNAEMEAHALKSAADRCKSMPGMKDENTIADLYLQAGMKLLLSSRHQEEVCEGSEDVIKSYSKAAKIIDDCTRRYEKIPDHGKAALAQIVAGLARMRLMRVGLVSSHSELEDLRKAESLFRQAKQEGESEKASHGGVSILPSRLYPSYNRFISTSANIYPMLECMNRANEALAIASAGAASTGDRHQQKGILEVRKVCSLVMLDDNFDKLVCQVYIALAAFGNRD